MPRPRQLGCRKMVLSTQDHANVHLASWNCDRLAGRSEGSEQPCTCGRRSNATQQRLLKRSRISQQSCWRFLNGGSRKANTIEKTLQSWTCISRWRKQVCCYNAICDVLKWPRARNSYALGLTGAAYHDRSYPYGHAAFVCILRRST